jgi:hypothetical protein
MDIYTAHYRYSGDDRLDITVKGSTPPGDVLAPTWEMVNGYRAGTIDQRTYTLQYSSLIVSRVTSTGGGYPSFNEIISNYKSLTLVCFCPAQKFCHRVLAAQILQNSGYGTYHGERIL